eukprot:4381021-Heterocapsa_arctica.AAC.1
MAMVRVANSMANPVIAPVIDARLLQWCGTTNINSAQMVSSHPNVNANRQGAFIDARATLGLEVPPAGLPSSSVAPDSDNSSVPPIKWRRTDLAPGA